MWRKALPLLKHCLSWRRQGTLSAPGSHFANSSGDLSVNSHSETNPVSLLKPDLLSVSAAFCQRRSATPTSIKSVTKASTKGNSLLPVHL